MKGLAAVEATGFGVLRVYRRLQKLYGHRPATGFEAQGLGSPRKHVTITTCTILDVQLSHGALALGFRGA